MKKSLIAFALVVVASAALAQVAMPIQVSPEQELAFKNSATNKLLDPAAAQFRNVRFQQVEGKVPVMCAEINAKNSMGGYVGFRPIAVLGDAELSVISPDFAAILCRP